MHENRVQWSANQPVVTSVNHTTDALPELWMTSINATSPQSPDGFKFLP